MQLSRFPIAYWGSISYYRLFVASESPLIEVEETYPKQTYRNRCAILTASGVHELSIPVGRINGSKTHTKDIRVTYDQDWQKVHWRAIKSAYASSPYFDHYSIEIEALLFEKHELLIDFYFKIHERICEWLDFPNKLLVSDSFQMKYEFDYLDHFEQREKQVDYSYQQVFSYNNNFAPDLSILDAIMNLGPMARTLFTIPTR